MTERTYNFPVFATQGGGLVREVSKNPFRYIFVEAPEQVPSLKVGDYMPEEWDLIPANQQARTMLENEEDLYGWDGHYDTMPDRVEHNMYKRR